MVVCVGITLSLPKLQDSIIKTDNLSKCNPTVKIAKQSSSRIESSEKGSHRCGQVIYYKSRISKWWLWDDLFAKYDLTMG